MGQQARSRDRSVKQLLEDNYELLNKQLKRKQQQLTNATKLKGTEEPINLEIPN